MLSLPSPPSRVEGKRDKVNSHARQEAPLVDDFVRGNYEKESELTAYRNLGLFGLLSKFVTLP